MTDFELTAQAVDEHVRALNDIRATVDGAGSAGSARVGIADFGAIFYSLVSLMNDALDSVGGSVTRHSAELAAHRADFERTARELVAADDEGAEGIPR